MGTVFRVVVYAEGEAAARKAIDGAFARCRELDGKLSDYKADSELNALGVEARAASPELIGVLRTAREVAEATDGAFDVTIGPLVRLWRSARRARELPSDAERREAMARCGWRDVIIEERRRTVRLAKAGMQLDLGGIAKGFAAEEMARATGVSRVLVAASGDIWAGEAPPGESGWRVALDWSNEVLTLLRSAVSTSGDREQFVEIDGARYSHIVDPTTGLGLRDSSPVTVVAPRGALADALATALSVRRVDDAVRRRWPKVRVLRP